MHSPWIIITQCMKRHISFHFTFHKCLEETQKVNSIVVTFHVGYSQKPPSPSPGIVMCILPQFIFQIGDYASKYPEP